MFDRCNDPARRVMTLARKEAQRLHHDFIGPEHILLGLIQEGGGNAASMLKNLGVEIEKVRSEIEKNVQPGPSKVTMGQLPFTPRAKKVLELSMEEANRLGHSRIGTEHLLLGLLEEHYGVAGQVLLDQRLTAEKVLNEVLKVRGMDPTAFQQARPKASRTITGVGTVEFVDHDGIVVGTVALSRERDVQVHFQSAFGRALSSIVFHDGKPFSSILYIPERGWRIVFKDQKGNVLGTEHDR